MSQQMIINMAMVFGIVQVANKFQLDAPENEFYVRLAYGSVQVIGLLLVGYIAWTINSKNDKTEFIYNETKNPFDKNDVEVIKTTIQEYDLGQAKALAFQNVLGAAIIVFMHLKWGYLRPMLLQSVLGLRTLSAAPIVQVYLFGKPATGDLARPWKSGASLGQTAGPTPKELKAKEKKDQKKKLNRID